jgi:hypothetical protein
MKAATQQETNQQQFARVLGKPPRLGAAKYRTVDQLGLFTETFGPPEVEKRKNRTLLFWNFTRADGADRFSLVSRISGALKPKASIGRQEVEVQIVAKAGIRSFRWWTANRLAAIESGDESPVFLGGAEFVVAPLN